MAYLKSLTFLPVFDKYYLINYSYADDEKKKGYVDKLWYSIIENENGKFVVKKKNGVLLDKKLFNTSLNLKHAVVLLVDLCYCLDTLGFFGQQVRPEKMGDSAWSRWNNMYDGFTFGTFLFLT